MKTNKIPLNDVTQLISRMREKIIDMAYRSKSGECGSALCIVDIIAVLYFRIMEIDPQNPDHPDRDRFILSKGHGGPALYTALALRGFFPESYLQGYRIDAGTLHLHPCSSAAPGIEVSTGSLGHGLSIGAGMALVMKVEYPKRKVFVLIGDGECNEGSIWEAAMFAATHQLNNLVAIIDENKFQGFGRTCEVHTMQLAHQWSAFGWNVLHSDGHDINMLEQRLLQAIQSDKPTVLIAKTINGKGVPEIENTLLAHYFVPNEKTVNDLKKQQ